MIRQSLKYVGWKQRKQIAEDLNKIYGAATKDKAELALHAAAVTWGAKFPSINQSWQRD